MLELAQVHLNFENGGMTKVQCAACGEELGRVQVEPQSREDDHMEWEEKVQGEIDVLRAEHQRMCTSDKLAR